MSTATAGVDKETFGERLREVRESRKLSRRELAAHTEISVHTIISWEQGRFEPMVTSVAKLADALRVPVEILFDDPGLPIPEPPRGRPPKSPPDEPPAKKGKR